MPKRTDINKVLIIGSGPIIIGQACEFDYSGTQACKALRKLGYKIVLVNSNPATIMTDPEIADVTTHSVITVEGTLTLNPSVKMGGKEVIPDTLCIDSLAEALPIADDSEIDSKMDYRWIDLRTDENQLMFKAQSCFVNAMRKFLLDRNFIEIHTPKLIAAASESGSEVFKVDYFDRNAYLAQSPT